MTSSTRCGAKSIMLGRGSWERGSQGGHHRGRKKRLWGKRCTDFFCWAMVPDLCAKLHGSEI